MGSAVSKLMFQPPKPASYTNTPNFFWLYTIRHQKIPAFFINRDAEFTILFSHGNAEDLGMIYDWFREVSRHLDVNVLAYDYDGYGLSEGAPSEQGVYADIEAAFNYLTDVLSVPADRVILYGRSLGSGPSCHLAMKQSKEKNPVRGVILQSPLMSAFRVAFHFRFSMPGDMFCNIDKVAHITSPVFVIHGRRDEVVPFWHGQELYLATAPQYRADPFWVESAGHNNIELLLRDTHLFFDKLKAFINYARMNPRGNLHAVNAGPSRTKSESSFACCAATRLRDVDGDETKLSRGEAKRALLPPDERDPPLKIEALPQWR